MLAGKKAKLGKITVSISINATAAVIFFDLKLTKIPPFFVIKSVIKICYKSIIQHIFHFVNNLS